MNACFVLAPIRPDLPTLPSEAQELVNILSAAGWRVQLMQEPATRLELWRALDKGPFSLGWVGTHSGSDGFALSRELLPPDLLGNFALEVGCVDLVLNSCFSAEHVDAIQAKATHTNIVATIRPEGIPDQEAWSEALYLARRLVKTGSLRTAQLQAGPQYRWFPARSAPGVESKMNENETLKRIEATTDRLVRALQGDEFSRQPGLIASMQSLQNDMRDYIKADAEWKRNTEQRIEAIEKIQAEGRTVTVQWRGAIAFGLTIISCILLIILATRLLSGG